MGPAEPGLELIVLSMQAALWAGSGCYSTWFLGTCFCEAPATRCSKVGGSRAQVGGNPEHPNMKLFSEFIPRCRATYTVLDIAGIVNSTADRLGLQL